MSLNRWIGMGRLTRDPNITYAQKDNSAIARFNLAVDRRVAKNNDNQQTADFIPVVALGKLGEFSDKYLKKGTKMIVVGRIQTGSYTNKDGVKVYTTEILAEEMEFAESKSAGSGNETRTESKPSDGGWANIPEGIDSEELPFR